MERFQLVFSWYSVRAVINTGKYNAGQVMIRFRSLVEQQYFIRNVIVIIDDIYYLFNISIKNVFQILTHW